MVNATAFSDIAGQVTAKSLNANQISSGSVHLPELIRKNQIGRAFTLIHCRP